MIEHFVDDIKLLLDQNNLKNAVLKVKGSVTDATSIAEILTRLDLVPTGPPPKSVGELEIVYDI